jgi:DNA-directed RNA polymerase subunit RPC12/RpoP
MVSRFSQYRNASVYLVLIVKKAVVVFCDGPALEKKGFYKTDWFFNTNMVNFYKCKKCETKFIAPLKIEGEKGHPTYVCPKCQSRNWGPLDW